MQHKRDIFQETFINSYCQQNPSIASYWREVDLKVLLSVLALAEPTITQTKVSQLIKISPVTLSRLVNSDDHRIREDWIPILTECLSSVDIRTISSTVSALFRISEQVNQRKLLTEIIPVVESYIHGIDSGYTLDYDFWGIPDGIMRFYHSESDCQWFISLGSPDDGIFWRTKMRTSIGPFTRFARIQSISENDKVSIIYPDSEWFGASVFGYNFRQRYMSSNGKVSCSVSLPCSCSLLLYNRERNRIDEGYKISLDSDSL